MTVKTRRPNPAGESPGGGGLPASRARRGWLAVVFAVFTVAWGGNEFTPLLVMYRENAGFTGVAVDSLLFAYVLGIVPALLIGGPLSDRLGRRPLMVPAPLFAALGSALLAAGSQSVAVLGAGRICSGIAIGLAMAVGGSWIKELSDRAGDPVTAGARRAALSLTAGFGLGAAVAAVLAQWGPWPNQLSYLVNIVMAVTAFALILPVPETLRPSPHPTTLREDLTIPSAGKPRFWLVFGLTAPWVFGTCATAYAVIPALFAERTEGFSIAFAGLCCLAGLTAGFFVQSLGRRIDRPGSPRALVTGLVVVAAGMALTIPAIITLSIPLALLAAVVLGGGYGMMLISALLEIQRMAGPRELGGLTAVFYSLTYLGFASPVIMAWLHENAGAGYPLMLGVGALLALAAIAVVVPGFRRSAGPAETAVDVGPTLRLR